MKKRKAIATQALEGGLRDRVLAAEAGEMLAHSRSFPLPTADSHVDVIALREDPAVAAGHVRELEAEPAPVPLAGDDSVGHVRLERDAVVAPAVEAGRSCGQTVDAVGSEGCTCSNFRPVQARFDPGVRELELCDLDPVTEVGPRRCGLVGEEGVEPAPLRHQHERLPRVPLEA